MRHEKGKSIDVDQYVGKKVKIEGAEITEMRHGVVIKLTSEVIQFLGGDELPEGKSLRASKILGLGVSEQDGSFVIIDDSKLDKFLRSKKVTIKGEYAIGDMVHELIGVQCVVQKTETGFLDLV
jgi:hypothetical protein